MIRTIPMIRVDDGKTADVHPDEVENWTPFGWAIDEARIQAQLEEDARIEREATEKARLEAERKADEAEEALLKTAAAAALATQEGQGADAGDQIERQPDASAHPGSGEQGEAMSADEGGKAGEPAIAEAEIGAGSISASAADNPLLTVGKGPRGLWFVKTGDDFVSKGFATEEDAIAAMAEIVAP